MPDLGFRDALWTVEASVPVAGFDRLVLRAAQRRRRRTGAMLGALAVSAAVVAITLSLPIGNRAPVVTPPTPTESTEPSTIPPFDPLPSGVEFGSRSHGVLLYTDREGATPRLFTTGDGGHSWVAATLPTADLEPPVLHQAADGTIVLAGVTDIHNSWRSTDGGRTWTRLTVTAPTSVVLPDAWIDIVGLPDAPAAYIVDPSGTIARWQLPNWLPPSIPSSGQDGSLWLEGSAHNVLGRSLDAGRTWARIRFPARARHEEAGTIVHARDSDHAIAFEYDIGDTTRANAAHLTTDGGLTWTTTVPADGQDFIAAPVPFPSKTVFTSDGHLLIAADNGVWTAEDNTGYRRISGSPGLATLARTADGLLYGRISTDLTEQPTELAVSVDNGQTWTRLDLVVAVTEPDKPTR